MLNLFHNYFSKHGVYGYTFSELPQFWANDGRRLFAQVETGVRWLVEAQIEEEKTWRVNQTGFWASLLNYAILIRLRIKTVALRHL